MYHRFTLGTIVRPCRFIDARATKGDKESGRHVSSKGIGLKRSIAPLFRGVIPNFSTTAYVALPGCLMGKGPGHDTALKSDHKESTNLNDI